MSMHERCAVAGAVGPDATERVADAMRRLDHRGPESTGLGGLTEDGRWEVYHAPGKARDVLTEEVVANLGSLGMVATVAHGRYPTSGGAGKYQPIFTGESIYVVNGNASYLEPLINDLGARNMPTSGLNDSEIEAWALAARLRQGASLVEAITDVDPLMVGAHSSVVVSKGLDGEPTLAAWRDPCGIRPLFYGKTTIGSYVVASETDGLDAAGAVHDIEEVSPGGLITINQYGVTKYQIAKPNPKFDPFEIIYFSNKNSLFKGVPIGDIRRALGARLAVEYGDENSGNAILGIPNSAIPYAEGYASALHAMERFHKDAIVKKRRDRTFMQHTKAQREALRDKIYLYAPELIDGFDIDATDDSMVRNNTARYQIQMLRELGARSVNFYLGSPPIRFPNFYGINIPHQSELVAAHHSIAEIRDMIGARSLGFLTLEGMLNVFAEMTGVESDGFDLSTFTGDYPINIGNRDIIRPAYSDYAA